jgi:hypothetical protein
MSDLRKLKQSVTRLTLAVGLIVSGICYAVFDFRTFIGVWIGVFTALAGFEMIIRMVRSLPDNGEDGRQMGRGSYALRYAFYALVLAVGALRHVPVLAMLAGFVCHKLSLLIYTYQNRQKGGE